MAAYSTGTARADAALATALHGRVLPLEVFHSLEASEQGFVLRGVGFERTLARLVFLVNPVHPAAMVAAARLAAKREFLTHAMNYGTAWRTNPWLPYLPDRWPYSFRIALRSQPIDAAASLQPLIRFSFAL